MTNRGAKALRAWIDDDSSMTRAVDICEVANGMFSTFDRWLEGLVLPCDEDRARIAELTDNAVTWAMWDEAVAVSPPVNVAPAAKPALLCELSGPLGTVPSGQLFRAIVDPARSGVLTVSGLGLAIVLDEVGATALRDVLAKGLVDLANARSSRDVQR
jgi:hypothetical protein